MGQELFLQITLDENGSVATVKNLGDAIVKTGSDSEGTSKKVDKLSDSFKKSDTTTMSFVSTLKALGLTYAAMRIERMVEGWSRMAIAQDTVDRTLKAAMITNNRYSEAFYQNTLKQAQALQKLTGVDDAQIEASQRLLMSFSAISNEAMPRASKAVLNLAAIMGAEGGGLTGATRALGKAMEGNTEGLSRFGIMIDKTAYSQRGALGVLEEVEKKVNGQAEELAKGSGQWKLFSAAADEAKESIGAYFNEVAINSGVLERATELLDKFTTALRARITDSPEKMLNRELALLRENSKNIKAERAIFPVWSFFGLGENRQKVLDQMESEVTASLTKIANIPSLAETIFKQTSSDIEPVKNAVKELTDEEKKAVKALEEVNDIIAKHTLTPYAYAVSELDKKYKGLGETLGDNIKLTKAYKLELDAIYAKYDPKMLFGGNISQFTPKATVGMSMLAGPSTGAPLAMAPVMGITAPDFDAEIKRRTAISDKYFADIEAKTKKITDQWNSLGASIGNSFTGAFTDTIMGDKGAFENLGKFIARSMISTMIDQQITQKLTSSFIQPTMNYIGQGIKGNLVSTGPPGPGQTLAPAWMGSDPNATAAYMGSGMIALSTASSLYQQQQSGGINPLSGGLQGAMGGGMMGFILAGTMAGGLGGPAGAAIGATIGIIIGASSGIISEEAEKAKNKREEHRAKILGAVDVLFDVVNGTVTAISSDASGRHAEAILAAKKSLQAQVDFYNQLAMMYGGTSGNMSFHYTGGVQNIAGMGLPGLVSKIDIVKQLGGDIMKQVEEVFKTSFANPYTSSSRQNIFSQLVSGEWSKIASGQETGSGLQSWLNQKRNWPGGEVEFTMGALNTNSKILEDFLDGIKDKLQEITDFFSPSIADAIADGFNSSVDKFGVFYSSLRENLASTVNQSLMEGFIMTQAMPLMMGAFGEQFDSSGKSTRPSLTNLLTGYQTGKYSLEEASGYTSQMVAELGVTIGTLEGPLKMLYDVMGQLNTSLGVNTTATQSNTDAVLGPVNSFLMSLDTGPLADTNSMAGLEALKGKLYTSAFADPSQFSSYAQFMTSSYLPQMQGVSSNYAGDVAGVRSQVGALPWYSGNNSAVDIGTAVAAAVGPMLLDLKEAANITINISVDGKEIKSAVISSLNDPAVVDKMRSRR